MEEREALRELGKWIKRRGSGYKGEGGQCNR